MCRVNGHLSAVASVQALYRSDDVADTLPGQSGSHEATLTGAIIKVNFPGKGILIQDIGRLVYADGFMGLPILFEAGHHEFLGIEGLGEQAFCVAFESLTS